VNEPDKTDENYERLWKMRAIFDKLNDSYAKNYTLTKHLAADEILCSSKVESSSNSTYQRNTKALQAMRF